MATANHPAHQDVLSQMADIQEPALGNDWYLAPGWWLLAALLLVLGWLLYRRYRQYRQQQAPRHYALGLLKTLDVTAHNAPAQITGILKRWLRSQQPTHPALTYSGDAWRQFLLQTLPTKLANNDSLPDLLALHYQPSPQTTEVQTYADFAVRWLQHANLKLSAETATKSAGIEHV